MPLKHPAARGSPSEWPSPSFRLCCLAGSISRFERSNDAGRRLPRAPRIAPNRFENREPSQGPSRCSLSRLDEFEYHGRASPGISHTQGHRGSRRANGADRPDSPVAVGFGGGFRSSPHLMRFPRWGFTLKPITRMLTCGRRIGDAHQISEVVRGSEMPGAEIRVVPGTISAFSWE